MGELRLLRPLAPDTNEDGAPDDAGPPDSDAGANRGSLQFSDLRVSVSVCDAPTGAGQLARCWDISVFELELAPDDGAAVCRFPSGVEVPIDGPLSDAVEVTATTGHVDGQMAVRLVGSCLATVLRTDLVSWGSAVRTDLLSAADELSDPAAAAAELLTRDELLDLAAAGPTVLLSDTQSTAELTRFDLGYALALVGPEIVAPGPGLTVASPAPGAEVWWHQYGFGPLTGTSLLYVDRFTALADHLAAPGVRAGT